MSTDLSPSLSESSFKFESIAPKQVTPLTLSGWRQTGKIVKKKPETLIAEYRRDAQKALDDNQIEDAIKLYNKAILLNPKDFSLFCCRSYCHELLEKYDLCLNDSQFSIKLLNEMTITDKNKETDLEIRKKFHNKLPYIRKARALKALERFDEAIEAFVEAKSHAICCQFIDSEIRDIKMSLVSKLSYDREDIEKVCDNFNKIEDIVNELNKNKRMLMTCDSTGQSTKICDLKPTNPFRYCGLYINGLSPDCEESKFEEMLTDCGTILRCKLYSHDTHSRAVITFLEPHSVREAVKHVLANKKTLTRDDSHGLVIRYRHTWILNGSDPQLKFAGDEIAGECYRWRTKGCTDSACKLIHIPICNHIDQLSGETELSTPIRKRISISSSDSISKRLRSDRKQSDLTNVYDNNGENGTIRRKTINLTNSVFRRLGSSDRKMEDSNNENGNNKDNADDNDNGDHDAIKSDIMKIINERKASDANANNNTDELKKLDRKARFKFDPKEMTQNVVKKKITFDSNRSLTSYDDLYDY